MSERKSSLLPGFILIVIGSLLLLNRITGFRADWGKIFPVLMLTLAILLFIDTFRKGHTGPLFWGTVLMGLGVFFLLRNYRLIPYFYSDEYWPVFFIAGGLGFLALFIHSPANWGVLIPAFFFILVGVRSGLSTFDLSIRGLERWIDTYWPVIFILLGLVVLFRKNPHPKKIDPPVNPE